MKFHKNSGIYSSKNTTITTNTTKTIIGTVIRRKKWLYRQHLSFNLEFTCFTVFILL